MMNRRRIRKTLIGLGLLVGIAGAAIGAARPPAGPQQQLAENAPMRVLALDVARILSTEPPEVVVLTLGTAKHPMPGALAVESLGASDEAVLERAPTSRRIILAGADPVRTDRLARRLMATAHDVRVLEGGLEAWDRAMDADPQAPAPGATATEWDSYRYRLALRRRYGTQDSAPPPVVTAAPLPAFNATPAAPKKREGC